MKRSDVIDFTVMFLDMHGVKDSWNHETIEEMVDELLEFMTHNIGMLPPTIDCEDWIDCEDGQGFVVYAKNEWEPED